MASCLELVPSSALAGVPHEPASIERRHRVYGALLDVLAEDGRLPRDASVRHSADDLAGLGVRVMPPKRGRCRICARLHRMLGWSALTGVPGFRYASLYGVEAPVAGAAWRYWTFNGAPFGLLVPVKDEDNRIVALRVCVRGRYRTLGSGRHPLGAPAPKVAPSLLGNWRLI